MSTSTQNPYHNVFDQNHTLEAVFTANPTYTIDVVSSPGGTVQPSGLITVNAGDSLTLTATPNSGYHVLQWYLDGVSTGAGSVLTLTNIVADHHVSVEFEQDAVTLYNVTVTAGVGGTVQPFTGTEQRPEGYTALLFTATPNSGYVFDKWTVNGVDYLINPLTGLVVNQDLIIVAYFTEEIIPPECTVSADCEGKFGVAQPGYHWECQNNLCVQVADTAPSPSGQGVFLPARFGGYKDFLHPRMVYMLWRLREKFIKPEVHKKLHPKV